MYCGGLSLWVLSVPRFIRVLLSRSEAESEWFCSSALVLLHLGCSVNVTGLPCAWGMFRNWIHQEKIGSWQKARAEGKWREHRNCFSEIRSCFCGEMVVLVLCWPLHSYNEHYNLTHGGRNHHTSPVQRYDLGLIGGSCCFIMSTQLSDKSLCCCYMNILSCSCTSTVLYIYLSINTTISTAKVQFVDQSLYL